jgi:hypothetical protein
MTKTGHPLSRRQYWQLAVRQESADLAQSPSATRLDLPQGIRDALEVSGNEHD